MCGIAGIWGGASEQKDIEAMLKRMVHRGPDAHGLFAGENGRLGHRRLSIMDPTGGDQPIYNENREHVIVANGEIYNCKALRKDLDKSHTFTTTSDSEAALHLYDDIGPDVVNKLDGMYAFAIADNKNIFAARDAIGIKPLYYSEEGGKFWLSSELNALAQHVDDIKEFPPGTFYHSNTGFKKFYSVPDIAPHDESEEYYIQRIRETLEECVVKRLMSDVPLGAFLSGGLDSSLIVALARKNLGQPFHTFSVGMENSRDLEAARMLSGHLDTIHHEHILTIEEIMSKLPEIIYHLESFDRDLVRSAIPCYFTSRLAAENVKVILTGEGADELFAGYSYYKDIEDIDDVLHRELRRSVSALHNVNLQRVDRLTMAHSIEGRVPFLALEMIKLGQEIPAKYKLRGEPQVEKWILRKAFEDLLPDEILWREKEQFDEGSGTVDLLDQELSNVMTADEAKAYQSEHPEAGLRCAEECFYHKIFMEVYDRPEPILANVGRWAERPEWINGEV